jgi:hypothetical protein
MYRALLVARAKQQTPLQGVQVGNEKGHVRMETPRSEERGWSLPLRQVVLGLGSSSLCPEMF